MNSLHRDMPQLRPCNVTYDREAAVVWFTGLSGAGKTTIANLVQEHLLSLGFKPFVLDGDIFRKGICSDLGFSDMDRSENLRRASEVAALLADQGFIVLAAFITPRHADRQRIRRRFRNYTFLEVFVDAPLVEAELRDPKGLYRKARQGELHQFTGIDSPYDIPRNADVRLDTTRSNATLLAEDLTRSLFERLSFSKNMGEARS